MSPPASQDAVGSHTLRSAYLWTAASNLVKQALLFATSMLLARLLSPADYGLLGMVTAFTAILLPIQDLGVTQAVIYFREREEEILVNSTAVSLAMGLALFMALFASAHAIAGFYSTPALVPIIRVISPTFVLMGIRASSQGLLMKRFQFKNVAIIEFSTIVIASIIAIVMALKGFGVWSLVANYVISATLHTILMLYFAPPRISFHLDLPTIRKLLRWSLPLTGAGLLSQFSNNVDYLIVGKLLGAEPLGFYTLAFRLANMIAEKVASVVNRVSFPSLAALRNQPDGAARHWLYLLETLGLGCFPLLAALAINARDMVHVVLGAKWLPSVPILQLLCWMGALKIVVPVTSNLISTSGRTDITFRISLITSCSLPVVFYIGCKQAGGMGVALAWAIVYTPLVLFQFSQAIKITGIPPGKVMESFRLPLLVTALYGVPGLAVVLLMNPGLPRLLVSGMVFAAAMGASLLHSEVRARVRRITRRS
jgi:O-antigen/teichoic acid export membrane protein